jgi:hypothetical protein
MTQQRLPIVLVAYDSRKFNQDDIEQFIKHMTMHNFENEIYVCAVYDGSTALAGASLNVAYQIWGNANDTLILQDLSSFPDPSLKELYETYIHDSTIVKVGETRILSATEFTRRNGLSWDASVQSLDDDEIALKGLAEIDWEPILLQQIGVRAHYCEAEIDFEIEYANSESTQSAEYRE